MADRAGNIAPESRMQGVILSETARRPRYGGRTHFCGKADRRNRCGTTRQAAPADTQAGIPRIQKPWSGPNGNGKRCGAAAGERSKEWQKKNQTEYRRRRTDRQSWRAAGRESYGRRELRAERAKGRQEENVRQEGRRNKGRCNEDRQDSGVRRQKKQACATAGPTTRPEGRHTIFISARPEYASQRRESSYRPA